MCLVWLDATVSTALARVGKSVLLSSLALWRIHARERFGEEQTVMHTGRDLSVCREVQRQARVWGDELMVTRCGRRMAKKEVGHPDGSRWLGPR